MPMSRHRRLRRRSSQIAIEADESTVKIGKYAKVVTSYIPDVAQIWIMRMILDTSVLSQFQKLYIDYGDEILGPLGLHIEDTLQFKIKLAIHWVEERLEYLEKKQPDIDKDLENNLSIICKKLGFSRTEKMLLAFIITVKDSKDASSVLDMFDNTRPADIYNILSIALDIDAQKAKKTISPGGLLSSSGLIEFDTSYDNHNVIVGRFNTLTGIETVLFNEQYDTNQLLSHFVNKAGNTKLTVSDFSYLKNDLKLLHQFLLGAIKEKSHGTNILIYGPTGCGKTELVKVLSNETNTTLYEVASEDEAGHRVGDRMPSYLFSQRLLARNDKTIILFDEVEDVFPNSGHDFFSMFSSKQKSGANKGWITRILETNPVPAVWLCNEISQIDPAFIRRFDIVIELKTPPRSVRQRILEKGLEATPVSDSWIKRMAELDGLTPAQVQKAVKVRRLTGTSDINDAEKEMERVITGSLIATGTNPVLGQHKHTELSYDLSFVNTDQDLDLLVTGLRTADQARICMFGPPGTGKTRFVKYLSEQLDRPLLIKRASDLLDPFVGITEQKIAAMFKEAEAEDAVLLLDEADSFFRDRSSATASWEVTQVNELLVQMEAFGGLFICATNHMDAFDSASLRRFDMKIELNHLNSKQSWAMFRQVLGEHGVSMVKDEEIELEQQLSKINNLTPGDFRTVVRRMEITGAKLDAHVLYSGLEDESKIKPGAKKHPMGFAA
jgi:transitional endoplasmic reticulum ATPase